MTYTEGYFVTRDADDNLISMSYTLNELRHRVGAPAYREWSKGGVLIREEYWEHGMLHREDGPAVQTWDGKGQLIYEAWYDKGLLQRSNYG